LDFSFDYLTWLKINKAGSEDFALRHAHAGKRTALLTLFGTRWHLILSVFPE
jgi:hypothetical protein